MKINDEHLKELEDEAIFVMREVAAQFEKKVILFSGGKDSIVLVHLAKKAFWPAKMPFSLMHIDTGHNFAETLKFRDDLANELGVELIVRLVQDSIDQGLRAMIIGSIATILFMLVYYRLSGLVANFALVLNILLLLAVLAGFRGTLTLPGLAGIVLTIGMAVDANVLINERIKEELRSGKTLKASIDAGYTRAFLTIMDSNLTTIIAAIFLFQFGTGPVKGFALTLTIGLLANIFTAVAVTRLIFDYFVIERRIKTLSI